MPVAAPRAVEEAPVAQSAGGGVHYVDLPRGVLDAQLQAAAIVQQCNCVGIDCRGLAAAIEQQLSYGNPYVQRRKQAVGKLAIPEDRPVPGSVDIRWPPQGVRGPVVINFFSQYEMGKALKYNRARPPGGAIDSEGQRREWFQMCLDELGRTNSSLSPIAFPHNIGCGLAGGRWSDYEQMIKDFASKHPAVSVLIVRQC